MEDYKYESSLGIIVWGEDWRGQEISLRNFLVRNLQGLQPSQFMGHIKLFKKQAIMLELKKLKTC